VKISYLILSAAIVLAAFGTMGYRKVSDHLYQTSAIGLEIARTAADRVAVADKLQVHVNALAVDGCLSRAEMLTDQHRRKPIITAEDIPDDVRSDLRLCIDRGILSGYARDDIKDRGLMPFLLRQT
jgi:hypothetical protein